MSRAIGHCYRAGSARRFTEEKVSENRPDIRFLLPPSFGRPGYVLLAVGAVLMIVIHGFRIAPEWLNWPVFAGYSVFARSRTFEMINNNVLDEWAGLFLIAGSLAAVLAREPVETPRTLELRLQAFVLASWSQGIAMVLVAVLTFGIAFVQGVLLALPVFPAAFLLAFHHLRRRG